MGPGGCHCQVGAGGLSLPSWPQPQPQQPQPQQPQPQPQQSPLPSSSSSIGQGWRRKLVGQAWAAFFRVFSYLENHSQIESFQSLHFFKLLQFSACPTLIREHFWSHNRPPGTTFWSFLQHKSHFESQSQFFASFQEKMPKHKKCKSGFRYVKYILS